MGLPGWLQHSQCLEILILNPLYYDLRRAGRPNSYISISVAGSRQTTGNRQWGHPEAIVFTSCLSAPSKGADSPHSCSLPASSGLPFLTGTHAPWGEFSRSPSSGQDGEGSWCSLGGRKHSATPAWHSSAPTSNRGPTLAQLMGQ